MLKLRLICKVNGCAEALCFGAAVPNDPTFNLTSVNMPEETTPFAQLSLERSVGLRWTLRDIKAKRMMSLPASARDIHTLLELGLIEMRQNEAVRTPKGHAVLD